MALMFESFGFKYGVPVDADFVFDVRCLPNPYWQPELRACSGLDAPVANFLATQSEVSAMYDDIVQFLEKWIPSFELNNRSYLTIAIGCTGGMHRSVYLADRLNAHFQKLYPNVQTRHRQLSQTSP
jgi:RNase adapter protein RapZ